MNPTIERPVTLDEVVVEEVPHIETLCDRRRASALKPFSSPGRLPGLEERGGTLRR